MFKVISKFFLAIILLNAVAINAHIYQIEKWSNGSQDIYCLSDYHISAQPHNKVSNHQRIEIVNTAKQHNACVITEDTMFFSYDDLLNDPLHFDPNTNNTHKIKKEFFELTGRNDILPPLNGLTAHCHYQGVPVDNVEFRLLKGISIRDGLIDSQTALIHSGIIREQIQHYNDSPVLNNYYREKIDEYVTTITNPCTPFFNKLCDQGGSLKDAKSCVSYPKQLDTIPHLKEIQRHKNAEDKKTSLLTLYDSPLLDLRIIHSIYTHKNYPTLMICAGGSHIENLKPALELMGFTRINSHSKEDNKVGHEPTAVSISNYFKSEKPNTRNSSWLNFFLNFF